MVVGEHLGGGYGQRAQVVPGEGHRLAEQIDSHTRRAFRVGEGVFDDLVQLLSGGGERVGRWGLDPRPVMIVVAHVSSFASDSPLS